MPVQVNVNPFASPRQVAFLRELAREREISAEVRERLTKMLDRHEDPNDSFQLSKEKASGSIQWMLSRRVLPGVVPNRIAAMPAKSETPRPRSTAETVKERQPERRETSATRAMRRDPATLLTSGVFRYDNETYIIVPTRNKKHIAKRWVETPARLTSSGETVHFDWVAAPGVIWALEEKHRLPVADIEAMLVQHRVCIYPGCYRRLKAANSVAAGAGKRHCERLGIPWKKKDREAAT